MLPTEKYSPDEAGRLRALRALHILDTAPETEFDDIVAFAARLCDTPMAVVTFVDENRQWFKASVGMQFRETDRRISICAYTITGDQPLLVPDTHDDERFERNPTVTGEPFIRSYAGIPIRSRSGHTVGTLAVMDHRPRALADEQVATLAQLARHVAALLDAREQRLLYEKMRAHLGEAQHVARLGRFELSMSTGELVASPEVYRMFGFEPTDAPLRLVDCLAAMHDDDRPIVQRGLEDAVAGLAPLDIECRIVATDGTTHHVRAHGHLDSSRPHRGLLVCGTAQDVSERRQMELALRRREEEYRLLFDAHPEPVWVYDVETLRFLAVNDVTTIKYGWSREEFAALTILDIRPSSDRQAVLDSVHRSPHAYTETNDWRHLLRDGTLIDVEIASTPIAFNGRNARLVVARDVTVRREAERALRMTEALRRIASVSARLGGWVLELPERRVVWSNEILELFDLQAESEHATPEALAMHRDSWRVAVADLLERCEQDGTPFDIELAFRAASGRSFWGRTIGEAERDADGRILRLRGAFQDVTERRRLEQQFLRSQRMESIGTLAGGIAHDLNNVLAPILLSIDLLRMPMTEDEKNEALDAIESSAKRGADMVRQVLTFARGVEGRRARVDPSQLVSDISRMIGDTFPRGIVLSTRVPARLPALLGDPTQLHQVLLNLAVNSRDAMPTGGRLTITCESTVIEARSAHVNDETRPGTYVVIAVEDSGTGIPRDQMDRIFDPFFTTKEPGQGTGLGLSTSLAIIRSHGGFIRVYSEPGNGTTFRVFLPAANVAEHEPDAEAAAPLPRGKDELILVIDDETSVRQITRQTLEAFGYRVMLATDGADAIAQYAVRTLDVACVLTDMMMPVMDGVTTIRVLRKMNPQLRIIAASGLAANGSVAKAAEAGVRHFLPKPYTASSLLTTLRQALDEEPMAPRQQ